MSMSDYPLHVRAAEAMGWEKIRAWEGRWLGIKPGQRSESIIPAFDASWCATGPLIESYGIDLGCGTVWQAHRDGFISVGHTPTVAVCNLIVELKEQGKL